MFRAGIASPVLAVLFRKGGVRPGTARLVAASQGGYGLLRLGGESCGVARPVGYGPEVGVWRVTSSSG